MSGTWTPGRIAVLLGLLAAGVLAGAAGWLVVDLWFPAGLVLALLALFGLFLGGRLALGTGIGVGAGAVGWFLAYVILSVPRAEGDFLLSSSGIDMYAYLLGGVVLAVMSATMSVPGDRSVSAARPAK
ncbi:MULTISPECIES: DUF6113 family protein [unclassified Streptomyces]|uniref:DUF6113 family protein n=1 Tax=unclassified Streptomyces TaxID=2593676 RepID=UPI000DC7628A|nr:MULTISPECIES: DUF6113 family protein [unclassified Streptomyces]AWZ06306.1 hypothetical protein DRB89_18630 [Streptomyces sp. ICC4]AWZ13895.1 hypothetical protein DRB96_18135 [Streptomyces sp. ICC1]